MSKKNKSPKPILWIGGPENLQYNEEAVKAINEDYFIIEYTSDNYSIEIVSESNPSAISNYGSDNMNSEKLRDYDKKNTNKSPITDVVESLRKYEEARSQLLDLLKIKKCDEFKIERIEFINKVIDYNYTYQGLETTCLNVKLSDYNIKKVCNYVANY